MGFSKDTQTKSLIVILWGSSLRAGEYCTDALCRTAGQRSKVISFNDDNCDYRPERWLPPHHSTAAPAQTQPVEPGLFCITGFCEQNSNSLRAPPSLLLLDLVAIYQPEKTFDNEDALSWITEIKSTYEKDHNICSCVQNLQGQLKIKVWKGYPKKTKEEERGEKKGLCIPHHHGGIWGRGVSSTETSNYEEQSWASLSNWTV